MTRKLAISLWYRAILLRSQGRTQAAQASITRATAITRTLREQAPDDAGALNLVAVVGEVDAQVLADAARYPESYARVAEVVAAHRRLVTLAGNTPGALRVLAQALRTGGGNHHNGGDYAGACRLWRESLATMEALQRGGTLTDLDARNSLPEMQDYVARGCRNGARAVAVGAI